MKKAKIMLMAIAVLAVVGGALAFKATKFQRLPYGVCDLTRNVCSLAITSLFSTTTAVVGILTNVAPPTQTCSANKPCITRLTVWL